MCAQQRSILPLKRKVDKISSSLQLNREVNLKVEDDLSRSMGVTRIDEDSSGCCKTKNTHTQAFWGRNDVLQQEEEEEVVTTCDGNKTSSKNDNSKRKVTNKNNNHNSIISSDLISNKTTTNVATSNINNTINDNINNKSSGMNNVNNNTDSDVLYQNCSSESITLDSTHITHSNQIFQKVSNISKSSKNIFPFEDSQNFGKNEKYVSENSLDETVMLCEKQPAPCFINSRENDSDLFGGGGIFHLNTKNNILYPQNLMISPHLQNTTSGVKNSLQFEGRTAAPTSLSAEDLKNVFLLHQKFGAVPSTVFSSFCEEVPHLPLADSFSCAENFGNDVQLLKNKRLRLSSRNDVSWLKIGNTLKPNAFDSRKRKRGVARLDRRQVLKCLSCGTVELGGYKYGDYVACSGCGINNFVILREWSPAFDGYAHDKNIGYSSCDDEP